MTAASVGKAHINAARVQSTNHIYVQCPLSDEQHFRLLRLRPGKRDSDSTLVADLIAYDLADAPSYIALSYSWGEQKDLTALRIGHVGDLTISTHLEQALRQLRLSKKSLMLWIDAICINQNNVDERSCQVRIMKQIFFGAEDVYIWMGMAPLVLLERPLQDGPTSDNQRWLVALNRETKDHTCFVGIPTEALVSILQSEDRVWYRRKWVLQEVAAARNAPLVLYDRYMFDGQAFFNRWPLRLLRRPDAGNSASAMTTETRFSETVWELWMGTEQSIQIPWKLRSWWEYYGIGQDEGRPLGELLKLAKASRASNPLDHVFALIGLASPMYRELISVDYNMSPKSLFLNVSKLLWTAETNSTQHAVPRDGENSSFDMLADQWARYRSPSWACDFSRPSQRDSDFHAWVYLPKREKSLTFAFPPLRPQLGDTVALFIDSAEQNSVVSDDALEHVRKRWQCHNVLISPKHADKDSTDCESTYRNSFIVSIHGVRLDTAKTVIVMSDHYKNQTTNLHDLASDLGCDEKVLRTVRVGHSQYTKREITQDMLMPFTLFTTELGHLGLCYTPAITDAEYFAENVRPGDNVVLLLGASIPFVLRWQEQDCGYILVAACMLSNDACGCRDGRAHELEGLEGFQLV